MSSTQNSTGVQSRAQVANPPTRTQAPSAAISPPRYSIHPHYPLRPQTPSYLLPFNIHSVDSGFDPRSTDTRHPYAGSEPDSDSESITYSQRAHHNTDRRHDDAPRRLEAQHRRRSPSPTLTTWPDGNTTGPRLGHGLFSAGERSPEILPGYSPPSSHPWASWADRNVVESRPGGDLLYRREHSPEYYYRNRSPTSTAWIDGDDNTVPRLGRGGVPAGERSPEYRPHSPGFPFPSWRDRGNEGPRLGSPVLDSAMLPVDDLQYSRVFMSRTPSPAPSESTQEKPEHVMYAHHSDPEPELSVGQRVQATAVLLEELSKAQVHDDTKSWEKINTALNNILTIQGELRTKVARREDSRKIPVLGQGDGILSPGSSCIICYQRSADTVLRPCGHLMLCSLCADRDIGKGGRSRKWATARCPVCKLVISDTMKTFRG